jgi:hypothetical protein
VTDAVGWQVVDRAEAAKAVQEKEDIKSAKSGVKKRRSHDDKLG